MVLSSAPKSHILGSSGAQEAGEEQGEAGLSRGLNINLLQRATRINIFINHVCAHYYGENGVLELRLQEHFNASLPFSARSFQ